LSETTHYPFIDALRGCAVLAVMAVHVGGHSAPPEWLHKISSSGNYGVQLFFVLSAFTLFASMHSRRGRDRHPTAAFFVRRFFRIAPLFWLAAAFYTGLHGLGSSPRNPEAGAWQILATLGFLHGWHPTSINSVVPGGWSIAVEMNFYLLLPLCFVLIDSLKRAVVAFVIAAPVSIAVSVLMKRWLISGHHMDSDSIVHFTYYWFPRQAPVFLLGFMLFFLIGRAGHADARAKQVGLRLIAVAALGLSVLSLLGDRVPLAYLAFSAGWMLLALGLSRYPTKLIVNPLLRHYGEVSFSAYLTHFFVLDVLSEPLMHLLDDVGVSTNSSLRFAALYAVCFCVTLLLSTLTHRLIEVPGQHLGRYLIRRWELGPSVSG
jgi:peptidoglycan/LPS O-acetylase OafA/YrhL